MRDKYIREKEEGGGRSNHSDLFRERMKNRAQKARTSRGKIINETNYTGFLADRRREVQQPLNPELSKRSWRRLLKSRKEKMVHAPRGGMIPRGCLIPTAKKPPKTEKRN